MFYLSFMVDEGYSLFIIFTSVILVLLYIFSPQIDWWWYLRYPPKLDESFRQLLRQQYPFYMQLSPENKLKFRQRVGLFRLAKDFMSQGMEEVPEDLKVFTSISGVHLTFGWEDFLLPKFEKIIIYPHPFPSPQYPEQFHASEVFEEDGVVLFSAQHLVKGVLEPRQHFPVGLYELAKVMILSYPEKNWPKLSENAWERLEQISGVSREALVQYINLEDIKPLPVSMVYFLSFPEDFLRAWPELYQKLNRVLRIYN
jgi:Mlc titration factor MtfA (ptsG expression regulator)